jgi:hypothetical protein
MRDFQKLLLVILGVVSLCVYSDEVKQPDPPELNYTIKEVAVSGKTEKDNALFNVTFTIKTDDALDVKIASGDISETKADIKNKTSFLWFSGKKAKIIYKDKSYFLRCYEAGEYEVSFDFSAKVNKKDSVRSCSFWLLPAVTRRAKMEIDSVDVELKIDGSLNLQKTPGAEKAKTTVFSALLRPSDDFHAEWKSHIDKLDAELVCSVKSYNIYNVLPGSVKISSSFNYKIIQGKLADLKLSLSPKLSVLNVNGQNVQDWQIQKGKERNLLLVKLSREYEKDYTLEVEAEKILPDFPCEFSTPSITPENILKLDGYMAFGTNKAVKLIIKNSHGLNQIDTNAFPRKANLVAAFPKRSLFTYMFSGNKFSLSAKAENIAPAYTIDLNYTLNVKDEDLRVKANCILDIKDAPLRELLVRYDKYLMVNRVEGTHVVSEDYELLTRDDEKWLKIPFKPDTIGKTELNIFFERSLKGVDELPIPTIYVEKAKSVRGYLLFSAVRGFILKATDLKDLKQVHTGSVPVRQAGLQLAYRFKNQDWRGMVKIRQEKTAIVSEVFQLLSIGEGSVYGSSVFSYHISGAPVKKILYSIDKSIKNIEFTGRNILDWRKVKEDGKENDQWELNLREKILGDLTFLVTYEIPLRGNEVVRRFGAISTVESESESAFIVLSSARNLKVADKALSTATQPIDISELPEAYQKLINNPVLKSYRSIKKPHWVDVAVSSYTAEQLLDIVVDHSEINTRIDRNGEAVSEVEYRIKNSSNQFLPVVLPTGAKLWSVRVNNERKRLSMSDGKLLIPLPRLQDINMPIAVSLIYAQKFGDLGGYKDLKLKGPVLNVESMYSKWTVKIPATYSATDSESNLAIGNEIPLSGMPGMFGRVVDWLKEWFVAGFIVPWLFVFVAGSIIAQSFGKRKLVIISTVASLFMLLIAFMIGGGLLSSYSPLAIKPFLTNQVVFSRLFTLPDDSMFINLSVSNMEGFSFYKLGWGAFYIVLAAVSFFFAIKISGKLRKSLLAGLGISFLFAVIAQWLYLNALGAFFVALLLPLALWVLTWIFLFRKARQSIVVTIILFAFLSPAILRGDSLGAQMEKATFEVNVMEKGIIVDAHYKIKADDASEIELLRPPSVMCGNLPKDSSLEIVRKGGKFYLKILSGGDYEFDLKFQLPFKKEKGDILFQMPIPNCNINTVSIKTDRENMKIFSENAVSFNSVFKDKLCSASASYLPGAIALVKLSPQARNVEKEEARFFATIDAGVKFAGGFVEISYLANLQIAQGEIAKFGINVPENMRVTSVEAPDLGAWKYQPDKNLLEVLLTQPHHGNLKMKIMAQITDLNLPYKAKIGCIKIMGAVRQHGAVGLIAASSLQIQDLKNTGLNRINNSDFPHSLIVGSEKLKETFRYFKPDAEITVQAIEKESELRVFEKTNMDFGDERTILESELLVEVAKAGIFSIKIELPEGFDVDILKGKNIQHWDEVTEKGSHKVIVNFAKRVLGQTNIFLKLSKMGKMNNDKLIIPKVKVIDAKRVTGDLSLSVERGAKVEILRRQGVEAKAGAMRKTIGNTVHLFRIHRPDWELEVFFDVASPWVQLDNLQKIKISDGVMECEGYFNYKIENAGLKLFRIALPKNAEAPEFSGRDIAGVLNVKDNIWEIELHKKAGKDYRLKFQYRLSNIEGGNITFVPAKALGTEMQTGYMAVFADGTEQVRLKEATGEVNRFDPRKIPASFRAGQLSNAVTCFRTVGNDYKLEFDIIRHKTAETLKAEVESVDVTSVVSSEGRIITQTAVTLLNGNETFLRLALPMGSNVWSVFVDEQPVNLASGKNGSLLIPLKQSLSGRRKQVVKLVYSVKPDKNWSLKEQVYSGPSFDLPLKNITWNLYLPPELEYSGFDGTLDYKSEFFSSILSTSISDYDEKSREFISNNMNKARSWLERGNSYASKGKQAEAVEAFQNAMNFSENNYALNDDIQGQWLQAQRKQSVAAIANRRGGLAGKTRKGQKSQAPQEESQVQQAVSFDNIQALEQELGGVEVKTLRQISDKMFFQQRAATAAPHPLRITIPEKGRVIRFERALQITPKAPMRVVINSRKAFSWKGMPSVFSIIISSVAFALILMFAFAAFRKRTA